MYPVHFVNTLSGCTLSGPTLPTIACRLRRASKDALWGRVNALSRPCRKRRQSLARRRWMKARIEREALLRPEGIAASRHHADEDEVPAMSGYRAGNEDEFVPGQQGVAESLLASAWDTGPQPVGIGNGNRIYDVNARGVRHRQRRQYVRNRVQRSETLVYRQLADRGRRIDRTIDRPHAPAVPAPAHPIGPFAAVPCRSKLRPVEAPGDEFTAAEWSRKRCHM